MVYYHAPMQRQRIQSSAIATVGYDPISKTLEIEFYQTGIYSFHGVPSHIHAGQMGASSKGTYYNDYIRDQYGTK